MCCNADQLDNPSIGANADQLDNPSSILDHFPDVGLSNIEQNQSKHRPVLLIYTSEHLLYVWILLLQHIDDATIVTRHCRDEMKSRSSSILDHFPDVGLSNIEQNQYRSIDLYYLSILQNTYSMYGYYFCNILTMLR